MRLKNNSKPFTVQFSGIEYNVPAGDFEVNRNDLGHHILFTANKWGKDVLEVSGKPTDVIVKTPPAEIKELSKKEAAKNVTPIRTPLEVKEVPAEEAVVEAPAEPIVGGASMDTLPKKAGRPKKVDVK